MSTSRFVAGIDAGGSKTRLLGEWNDEDSSIRREGPGANPNRIGRDEAGTVLVDLVAEAVEQGPAVDAIYVSAGVSGAGQPAVKEALVETLERELARLSVRVSAEVVHDGVIALDAAYEAGSGIIIISGTGSVVVGRTREGRVDRAGGWGPILGDDGSGYALGQAGLRAVAEAFDGGEDTILRSRVQDTFGIASQAELLGYVYSDAFEVQNVAPMVVEAAAEDDAQAVRALNGEITRLVRQTTWIVHEANDVARRFTLLGGMMENDHYVSVLRRRLRSEFPDWSVEKLETDPVVGALRRARRLRASSSAMNSE